MSELKRQKVIRDAAKPIKNQRHEIFAQEIAQGTKTPLAYIAAGYKTKDGDATYTCASRLLRSAQVARRIAWLQQKAADAAIITKESLINETRQIVKMAKDEGQYSAALKGLQMLGLERSTFIPKQENGRPGDFSEMPEHELDAFLERTEGVTRLSTPRKALEDRSGGVRGKPN